MRADQDYDYFYEVDGEIRYDFECEFNDVEVAKSDSQANLTRGQIIIAN